MFKSRAIDLVESAMEISRELLVAAHKEYEEAVSNLQKAQAAGRGVHEAQQRFMAARTEYLRLLRAFSDLILGKNRHENEP